MSIAAPAPYQYGFDRTKAAEFEKQHEACATCRFWQPGFDHFFAAIEAAKSGKPQGELHFGFCRRKPPKIIEHLVQLVAEPATVESGPKEMEEIFNSGGHFDATAFPGTFYTEWCGEFQWLPELLRVEVPL